jgi:methyl acetate hydrolase
MGYTFNSPILMEFSRKTSHPSFLAANSEVFSYTYPLVSDPTSEWRYSIGIDWAGILITRITGDSLEVHFRKHIFDPLGLKTMTFYPTEEVKKKMMSMTYALPGTEGKEIRKFDNDFAALPHSRESDPDKIGPILAGGAGLFGTAKDYLAILRAVLKCDPARASKETDGHGLISPESFTELFNDSIPAHTPKTGLIQMMKGQTYHDPSHDSPDKVGHSIGLCLNKVDSVRGRKGGSGSWDGAAKTQFWIDPVSGIAVSIPCRPALVFLPSSRI